MPKDGVCLTTVPLFIAYALCLFRRFGKPAFRASTLSFLLVICVQCIRSIRERNIAPRRRSIERCASRSKRRNARSTTATTITITATTTVITTRSVSSIRLTTPSRAVAMSARFETPRVRRYCFAFFSFSLSLSLSLSWSIYLPVCAGFRTER
jgi:hypothetical protein